jgi:hypothetical protein
MVIQRSVCAFAVQRSCRARTRMGSVIGLHLRAAPRAGWAALGWFGVCGPARNRTLALPEEAKVPGVSLTGGSTLKQTGGGLYRQMEVITMAVAAMFIAAGVSAVVLLGILVLMGVGWFISSSL